jgi:hypothetical protein
VHIFQKSFVLIRDKFILFSGLNFAVAFFLSIITALINLNFFSAREILKFGYTENFTGIANLKSNFPKMNSSLYLDTGSNFYEFSDFPVYPNSFREPLYPFFLKVTMSLFEYQQVIWIQRLLMLFSIFLLTLLFLEKFGKIHSFVLFLVINLLTSVPFFYSQLLYPYSLSFALSTSALFVFAKGRNNWKIYAFSGFLMGLVALERQQALIFPITLTILVFLRETINVSSVRRILAFVSAFLIAISPGLANGLSGNYLGISSAQGYVMGYGFGADVSSSKNDCINSAYLSSYAESVKKYGADSGSLYFLGSQVIKRESTIAIENQRLSGAIIQCLKNNPSILFNHSVRNLLHLSERMITPRNPFTSKDLGEYWDANISMKPRFENPTTFVGLLLTGYVLLTLTRRFRKVDSIEVFIFAQLLSTGLVAVLTIYDPRYRINIDWLLYALIIKYASDFFKAQNFYRRMTISSRRY